MGVCVFVCLLFTFNSKPNECIYIDLKRLKEISDISVSVIQNI